MDSNKIFSECNSLEERIIRNYRDWDRITRENVIAYATLRHLIRLDDADIEYLRYRAMDIKREKELGNI